MNKTNQSGLTLLEVLLVLVLITTIVLFSLRQYEIFKLDAEVKQVRANVDNLLQAGANYYQANCNHNLDSNQTILPISVNTLQDQDFLTAILAPSPLIDDKTYVVQLNKVKDDPNRMMNLTPTTQVPVGKIIIWRIQVAAKLKDEKQAETYKNLLGADCLSNANGGSVTPCESAVSQGNYAVWERLPSFASAEAQSDYWVSNPLLKQFNQMYTTYPILSLTNQFKTSHQDYRCGS